MYEVIINGVQVERRTAAMSVQRGIWTILEKVTIGAALPLTVARPAIVVLGC